MAQAVALIQRIGAVFPTVPVLVVCDSCFRNNGLLKPLRQALGPRAQLLSRLRTNAALYDLPTPAPGRSGCPRTDGERLGNAASLAITLQPHAHACTLNLYGKLRTVMAVDRVVTPSPTCGAGSPRTSAGRVLVAIAGGRGANKPTRNPLIAAVMRLVGYLTTGNFSNNIRRTVMPESLPATLMPATCSQIGQVRTKPPAFLI